MTSDPPTRPRFSVAPDNELVEYRAVSGLAIGALVLGVLSAAAILDPWCWLFPVLGLTLGAAALGRIAWRTGALVGRRLALTGMGLSLAFGVTSVGHWAARQYLLQIHARQFAQDFFDCLALGRPEVGYQLLHRPVDRLALGAALWAPFRRDPEEVRRLRNWVDDSAIKTLLLLGKRATVRYCGTERIWQDEAGEYVNQVFSVTYDDPARGRTTFYVLVTLRHAESAPRGHAPWVLIAAEAGVRPYWLSQYDS